MWGQRASDRATPLFVTLMVASFLLMTLDVRSGGSGFTGTLRGGFQQVFSPVQEAAASVVRPLTNALDGVANIAGLRAENQRLRGELEALRAELGELSDFAAENAQLRALLNISIPEQLSAQTVAGRVMAVGPSSFDHTVTIDRGLDDGVAVDMPVVDEQGLVGRIVSVAGGSAVVGLIIDPEQRVAVRASRTRDLGVATGRGDGPLSLVIFEASGPLAGGDRVVTAGSDLFPPGLVVGKVVESARAEAGFLLQTSVRPAVSFNQLDYVKVILWTSELVTAEQSEGAADQESAP